MNLVPKDLAKQVEKADMDAQRKRAAYFELAARQNELLQTRFLNQVEGAQLQPAPTFPAERTLLKRR